MKNKELYKKHSSKLYKGFLKQCKRQDSKPETVKLELKIAINLHKNFKGQYKHSIKFYNSKWNGMNLKNLVNGLYPLKSYGGMYSKFRINEKGIVSLSFYGKKILKNKKLKN